MRRTMCLMGRIGLWVLLFVGLLAVSSCSKKEPSNTATPPPAAPKADTQQAKAAAPASTGDFAPYPSHH